MYRPSGHTHNRIGERRLNQVLHLCYFFIYIFEALPLRGRDQEPGRHGESTGEIRRKLVRGIQRARIEYVSGIRKGNDREWGGITPGL